MTLDLFIAKEITHTTTGTELTTNELKHLQELFHDRDQSLEFMQSYIMLSEHIETSQWKLSQFRFTLMRNQRNFREFQENKKKLVKP